MFFDIPFDTINESHLDALIEAQERESKTIEYKLQVPGASDADRKEFLFDLSSFANSSGGDIFYGVQASNGLPQSAPGMSKQKIDAEILRLESLAQTGVSPRIPGMRMRAIDLKNQNCVLVVRIPKPWAGPHMVTFKGTNKFYSRNSAGKYLLDVDELRAAFSLGDVLAEKIRAFRIERTNVILNRQLSVNVTDAPKCVLHILPVASFRPGFRVDLHLAQRIGINELIPMTANGWNRHFNYSNRQKYAYPTFIITDLKMPNGDGFSVLEFLKGNPQWKVIPTIVLSASADLDDIKKSYMLGASSYHVKPQSPEELRNQLKVINAYWMTCQVPEVDSSGKQLVTDSEGKLGERFKQDENVVAIPRVRADSTPPRKGRTFISQRSNLYGNIYRIV